MYDYIIIGAGSAGCVLANRLTENPNIRVLLLEAGQRDTALEIQVPAAFSKLFKTDLDWNYATAPQSHLNGREVYWPRGKMLGGSSSMNAMIYIRGNPQDYDAWQALGNDGWNYDAVLPYFKRAEHNTRGADAYHGVGGGIHVEDLSDPRPPSLAFIQAAMQCGIPHNPDFNGAHQEGVGLYQVTMKHAARHSAAAGYLKPILARPNLIIQTGAHVTRLFSEHGLMNVVEYQLGGIRVQAEATREILLCGGAINTPQVLMLSGIGDPDQLAAHDIEVIHPLRGVGQNLQDHLAAGLIYHGSTTYSLYQADAPHHVARYLLAKVGPLTSNVAEGGAYVRTRAELATPDIQFHFAPNYFVSNGFANPEGHGLSLGAVLVTPHSRGEIRLASANPFDAPIIQPNYLSDPRDLDALLAGVKLGRRIMAAAPMRPFIRAEYLPGEMIYHDDGLIEHIRNTSETLYHPIGTCKMGSASDPLAVVDAELRLHGVKGVRVVDASIMPVVPNGNTNAPVLMIAEKAAAMIKAGWD
ncbi:MAG: GMC family oxidoreductase [Phototrophicaceae bacterium]|jgi:choline dehydrogenase